MPLSAFHLQLLGEVQRAGSLAGAARALGVSPPAVSQQVARVEAELGAAVVSRGSRGASLTELGAALALHGRAITEQVDAAAEASDRLLGRHARRLRVGAVASTVQPILADALATIRLRYPDSELSVVEVGSDTGVELVAEGSLDLALVAGYGTSPFHEGLAIREVSVDELLLVVPDDHALVASEHDHRRPARAGERRLGERGARAAGTGSSSTSSPPASASSPASRSRPSRSRSPRPSSRPGSRSRSCRPPRGSRWPASATTGSRASPPGSCTP